MLPLLNKLLDSNEREVGRMQPIVNQINDLGAVVKKYKDKDFPKKTQEFKDRIAKGESLDSILPEAFALVREAARRTIGLYHYDVQIMAAIALARGKIAEQKTGEGKTLAAIPALYLHALTGKGVHLVTVNDYLARRDAGWMGPIFSLLGITIASIISEQSFKYERDFIDENAADPRLAHLKLISRKEAYQCDVVYGINSEFGFDYLRDNMAQTIEQVVQRSNYYAIVDEVDSVLIDEARTPHIISAPDEAPSQRYYEYAQIVDKLISEIDYKVDEKMRTVHLTDHGIGKIEKLYGIKNIYETDFDTVYHLEAALKARTLFHREKDYIVRDNEVILVDEFTGRLMVGRRLSEGIHQAIEAKENVPIQKESKTMATVSLQNYFRLYGRLAGMTGTAVTESEEFHKIYNLDVVVIPTNNPMVRDDRADIIYKTGRAKFSAVVAEIEKVYKTGQPVLVGTTSIEKNEIVSELLKRRKIPHKVLNAKNHLKEAEIIAQAGKKGAVTIATNMAGRGVDIVLGGEQPNPTENEKAYQKELEKWKKEHDEVVRLGGLYVIGTERHESRRIDNQLRGRSGRQGDPGVSQFFVGLDDEIMRLFGGDKIAGIMTRFNMPEDVPLTHQFVSKAIENAQVKVEGFYFDNRKHLVEYDDVLNKQREIIYSRRREVLEAKEGAAIREEILQKIQQSLSSIVSLASVTDLSVNEKIIADLQTIIPFDQASQQQLVKQLEQYPLNEQKIEFLSNMCRNVYLKRVEMFGEPLSQQIERGVSLNVIDTLWMNHLDVMDNLRQGIGLRGYAQRDPLVEYKNEGFRLFEQLLVSIDDEIVHRIYKIQVQQAPTPTAPQQESVPQPRMVTNTPEGELSEDARKVKAKKEKPQTVNSSKQLGRNDPCWCGSGKKWKKCHLNREPHTPQE
ncbi:MAG TPA: preprotein translocase subunit SecA [Patescibacteria group bacterium]|nr:preprotein translocase subunit SecA [Patescibacteria group bacterium]